MNPTICPYASMLFQVRHMYESEGVDTSVKWDIRYLYIEHSVL